MDELDDEIDDLDFGTQLLEDNEPTTEPEDPSLDNEPALEESGEAQDLGDYIDLLLKAQGIDNRNLIQFENEDGETEDVAWDDLDDETKFNILNTKTETGPQYSQDELNLISSIRSSGLSPLEYMQYVQQAGINSYMQQVTQPRYSVDEYSDDELFVADLLNRIGEENLTREEVEEALDKAKSNEAMYTKLIGALRAEYKRAEDENNLQVQAAQTQQAQAQFQQFSDSVVDSINGFTDLHGCEVELDSDDMLELYDFITGQDAAGNNWMAKALADPKTLTETAYFVLHGKDIINDITEYFQKEITKVRKESYKKGKEDASKPRDSKSNFTYKPKKSSTDIYNDDNIDDF